MGILREGEVLGLRSTPTLAAVVGFVVDLEVVHVVIVADVEPVNGGENVTPPDVPVIGRHWWIGSPCWIPIVVAVANRHYRPDTGGLEVSKNCSGVTLPESWAIAPPVIAAIRWISHRVIPPCPVDDIWIGFDLVNSWCAISAVGILPFPA